MKIVDDDGNRLPHDGEAAGRAAGARALGDQRLFRRRRSQRGGLRRRGLVPHRRCLRDRPDRSHDDHRSRQGPDQVGRRMGSRRSTSRARRWATPDIAETAAIAMPHPKWTERPMLVVVPRDGATLTRDDVLAYLDAKSSSGGCPTTVVFTDELPHTATGKVSKVRLRERYADHILPTINERSRDHEFRLFRQGRGAARAPDRLHRQRGDAQRSGLPCSVGGLGRPLDLPADHGGDEGQGARRRLMEPVPARKRARRRADQPRVRALVRDHGPLANRARGVQLFGARHRQHGGVRPLLHTRAAGNAGSCRCSPAKSARPSR